MKEIEILEKRGKREKHFLQENGEIIAKMYSDDIHFKKNGKYEEIDNTLIEEENYYVNKNNNYKVYFPKNTKGYIMRYEKDDNYIEFYLENCNDVLGMKSEDSNKLQSSIKFENILNNIDLEYIICPTKVKENIILKSEDCDYNNIKYILKTNLELKIKDNKSIDATKNGEVIFSLNAPFMMDGNNAINDNLIYKLKKMNSIYYLSIVLDEDWLFSNYIKFPIIIDPTIKNNGQNGGVYDTYIYPGDTSIDRNSQDILKAGVEKINGNNVINRTLIKFDLPTIGTGCQITNAFLNLMGYPVLNGSFESDIVAVHNLTSTWEESTANWNNMNDKFDSRVEGIFDSYRSNSDSNGNLTPLWNGCDLTNLVKRWYSDTPNYGIMLKMNEEEFRSDIIPAFFSKDNNVTGNNPKPFLTINYRDNNGIEEYMDYQKQQFTNGEAYLNNYTGNLTCVFSVGNTIGSNLPIGLSIVYNTNNVILEQIGICKGVKFNYYQTIEEVSIENITYLKFLDGDGTIHYFTSSEGIYKDEDGLNYTIEKLSDSYIMKDSNGQKKTFNIIDNVGYLVELSDCDNNSIFIEYVNKLITKIIDCNNNEVNISYFNDHISINSPTKNVTINIENNRITSISSQSGITLFLYNDLNLINCIVDVNGKKINYEYYNQIPYRIKKVSEYGLNEESGQSFLISYEYNSTTIIDNLGKTYILTFNDNGNLISICNLENNDNLKNAYGLVKKYSMTENNNKNKLLSSGIPVKYVKNYLNNSSFEIDDIDFLTSENINVMISDDYSYTGFKSLKIISTSNNQYIYKSVNVNKNSYYTFSAYVKNDTAFKIRMYYLNSNNELIENVNEVTVINDSFKRYDLTIFYPSIAQSDLFLEISMADIGILYVDDIQLEDGEVANKYNMLYNSDFSNGLSDWELSARKRGTDINVDVNTVFEVVNINDNGDKALQVKMKPENVTSFKKKFDVKGKIGEQYNISFWYKDEGFYASGNIGDPICNNVIIFYDYIDDNLNEGHCILPSQSFNPNNSNWQYYSATFKAEKDFKSLTLNFYQEYNANNFYITNLYLYKDVCEINYEYDSNGNVTSLFDLDNNQSTFNYDSNNQLIKMSNLKNNYIACEYYNDIPNRLINGMDENGIYNHIDYDAAGNPVLTRIGQKSIINENDQYYKIRIKGTKKYISNHKNCVSINDNKIFNDSWLVRKIDSNYAIYHSIIANKCLTVDNNKLVLSNYDENKSLFVFEKQNNNSVLIRQNGTENYFKLNENEIILSNYEIDDYHYQFYFESIGSNQFIETNSNYFENSNYIKEIQDTLLNKITYDLNMKNGLILSITNSKGIKTFYNYNNKNQICLIQKGNNEVQYYYNDKNAISNIVQNNKNFSFIYDNFLNIKQIKLNNNINFITNDYFSNNGNLKSSIYGNDSIISFSYDLFNRIKSLKKMDREYKFKYDSNGDLVKVLSNDYIVKFEYGLSKKLNEYNYNGLRINYSYDNLENTSSKSISFYDNLKDIKNIKESDGTISKVILDDIYINYKYDSLGRLTNKRINDDYEIEYNYLKNGNRNSYLLKNIKNDNENLSYKYDKLKNITRMYLNNALINQYHYDVNNQLVLEKDYRNEIITSYHYDTSGNILSKKTYDLYNYNFIKGDLYEYANNDWEDQLTKFNNVSIGYDNIGNVVTIGNNVILNWINGTELASYSDGVNEICFSYNHNGVRTKKQVNNSTIYYYLEGKNIVFEQCNNDLIYFMRDNFDELLGLEHNGTKYYYVKNVQNDIIKLLDDNYNVVVNYEYDSWGNILSITDSNGNDVSNDNRHIGNINPFRYRSYYYDKETRMYYLNNRYYNPQWGRFISADVILSSNSEMNSYNLYVYAGNNPINNTDPNGNSSKSIIKKTIKIIKKTVKKVTTIIKNIIKQSTKKASSSKKTTPKTNYTPPGSNPKYSNLPDYTDEVNKLLIKNCGQAKVIMDNFSPSDTLKYFYDINQPGAEFDYKIENVWNAQLGVPYPKENNGQFLWEGYVLTPEDLGNLNYGFVGTFMGFEEEILYAGGGYANQGISTELFSAPYFGDNPNDHIAINIGIYYYNNGMKINYDDFYDYIFNN